jgi:hypothetical protein
MPSCLCNEKKVANHLHQNSRNIALHSFQSMVDIRSGRLGLHVVDTVALVFKVLREPAVIPNLLLMVLDVQGAVQKLKTVNIQASVQVKVVMVNGLNGHCVLRHVETVHR